MNDDHRLIEQHRRAAAEQHGPVVSVRGDIVIASRDALDFLQLAGRELVALRPGDAPDPATGGTTTRLVRLPDGSSTSVTARFLNPSDPTDGVVLAFGADTDPAHTSGRVPARPASVAGVSEQWQGILRVVQACARSSGTVSIEADRGVGKVALAAAMHEIGRPDGGFRLIDAASNDTVAPGRWLDEVVRSLQAPSGTVVLRHVERLDRLTTTKLLGLVDAHHQSAVRIVMTRTTTERNRVYGADRYERRRGVVIEVPPLRERPADDPVLVAAISSRLGRGYQRWTAEALETLARFDWPGNVRQLEDVVASALLGRPSGNVGRRDLPEEILLGAAPWTLTRMEVAEASEIAIALRESAGNKVGAAKALGISRSTLYRKIRSFGFDDRSAVP